MGIIVSICTAIAVMTLVFSAYAAGGAAAGGGDWMKDWIPFIGSSIGGIMIALIALLPSIRKVGALFMDAVLELNIFMNKYKDLLQGEVRSDLMKVLSKFDVAFDLLALIMGRIGAKKLSSFLQDIIKSEWFNTRR